MLLTLMYHQVINDKFPNGIDYLDQHFSYLHENFSVVVPGEILSDSKKSVCLTFDDAYFDFYYKVYPLLKKHNLKAVLAIPVKFILDDTDVEPENRLTVPYAAAMDDSIYDNFAPFCTWKEIREMVDSGHVIAASHSYNHVNLTNTNVDLTQELTHSKKIITEKTGKPVEVFVYPFGRMNRAIQRRAQKDYQYVFRIGSALNFSWNNCHGSTYRIDADHFWPTNKKFTRKDYIKFTIKLLSNTLRGR